MEQSIAQPRGVHWHVGMLPVLLLTALVIILYWPSATALAEVWGSNRGVYSQGYLIAAASVWILATRAREMRAAPRPHPWGAALVLLLGFLWLISARSGIQTAEALLLPPIVWAAILAMFGAAVARACLFPCALLLLAIPIWDPINAPLQNITTPAAALILRALQVPTEVAGNLIHIRAVGTFEIAPECSGLGMLLVGLTTAALYGEMQRQPWPRRLALLALAGALSIAANWVRVAGIILLAYFKGMHFSLVQDHYGLGWVVFALMLLGFFPLARRIAGAPPAPLPSVRRAEVPAPRALLDAKAATALILSALALAPLWNWVAGARPAAPVSARLPELAGWAGPATPATADWTPQFPGADAERSGVYSRGAQQISAFTAAYGVQRHAKKLVGYGVEILAPEESVVSRRPVDVGRAKLAEIEALAPGGQRALVWAQYTVGERHFTSAWWAQLGYGWASLSSAPASRIMLFRASCAGDCTAARAALKQFVSDPAALNGT
jgi:EpsI family protein